MHLSRGDLILTTALLRSIIQRAGMVPLTIAGIAKEVTTIICAAWLFGDELTPLNITGVGITVVGASLHLPSNSFLRVSGLMVW